MEPHGERGSERAWDELKKGQSPPPDWIRDELWTAGVDRNSYPQPEKYHEAILDQYKTYVEMADRISARRGLTNTFFLTLNSAVFTVVTALWANKPPDPSLAVVIILASVALAQCIAWYLIVRSYRQLNAAKYNVIGLFEERLPASPYDAEWAALRRGGDWRVYWPLTHVEQWVPILFGASYLAGAVIVVLG